MAAKIPHSFTCFSPTARRWVPVVTNAIHHPRAQKLTHAHTGQQTSRFDLVSWNTNYASGRPSQRCLGLLNHTFNAGVPDILCLQEVRLDVRAAILANAKVRDDFLVTDAEPNLENKVFSTITMLSKQSFAYDTNDAKYNDGAKFAIGPVYRNSLPSATERDALFVSLIPPDSPDCFFSIINVHLESRDAFTYRSQQLHQVASALHEPRCRGGLIVGDFNATTAKDQHLLDGNGLEDAWLNLYGDSDPNAPTWGVGARRDARHKPQRLDKIAMVGVVAEKMEVIHPRCIESGSKRIQWSDHSGLRGTFAL